MYDVSDEDLEILESYKIDVKEFKNILRKLETLPGLRPFERKLPWWRKLLFKLLTLIIFAVYIYACFVLL